MPTESDGWGPLLPLEDSPPRRLSGEEREALLDLAEQRLLQAVDAAKPWAIKFVLSTLGKNRGYTERTELVTYEGEVDDAIERELERLARQIQREAVGRN